MKILGDDYTELKQGSQYLLFLRKNGYGQWGIINMNRGKFNLDGSDPNDLGRATGEEDKSVLKADVLRYYGQRLGP